MSTVLVTLLIVFVILLVLGVPLYRIADWRCECVQLDYDD